MLLKKKMPGLIQSITLLLDANTGSDLFAIDEIITQLKGQHFSFIMSHKLLNVNQITDSSTQGRKPKKKPKKNTGLEQSADLTQQMCSMLMFVYQHIYADALETTKKETK